MTTDRKIVVWKFNPCAAFRTLEGHRDWVEDVILVRRREDPAREDSLEMQIYSAGSDGVLLRWASTSSANGDLYSVEEEMEGHEGSVLCCTYSEDLDVIISGSEDLTIRIWELGTPAMRLMEGNDSDEKDNTNVLEGHEGRVTGLACCSDQVRAASICPPPLPPHAGLWESQRRSQPDACLRAHACTSTVSSSERSHETEDAPETDWGLGRGLAPHGTADEDVGLFGCVGAVRAHRCW